MEHQEIMVHHINAAVAASMARIAAMQAENTYREQCGNSIAYGEEAFHVEATLIQNAANDLRALAG